MPKKNGSIESARAQKAGRRFSMVEANMLDRTTTTIRAEDWEAFEAWINRPAEIIPALAELVRITPSWKK